jgi:hypothetical protein
MLELAPLAAALVVEPWAAIAALVALLRRKAVGQASLQTGNETPFGARELSEAGTALLGVCVVIIVALASADLNAKTWSDEIAWIAAGLMIASLVLGRTRGEDNPAMGPGRSRASYWSFLAGAFAVLLSLAAAIWQL